MNLTKEQEAKLILPDEVDRSMKQYSEKYSMLKTPRQLKWRPHQGVVSIDTPLQT